VHANAQPTWVLDEPLKLAVREHRPMYQGAGSVTQTAMPPITPSTTPSVSLRQAALGGSRQASGDSTTVAIEIVRQLDGSIQQQPRWYSELATSLEFVHGILRLFAGNAPPLSVRSEFGLPVVQATGAAIGSGDVIQVTRALAEHAPHLALAVLVASLASASATWRIALLTECATLTADVPEEVLVNRKAIEPVLLELLASPKISIQDKLGWKPLVGDATKGSLRAMLRNESETQGTLATVFYGGIVAGEHVLAGDALEHATDAQAAQRMRDDLVIARDKLPPPGNDAAKALARLEEAIQYGDLGDLQRLLEKSPALLNAPATRGDTPLHQAARAGRLQILRWLLRQQGIEVNAQNAVGSTPAFVAACRGHREALKSLLADPRCVPGIQHATGMTALFVAAGMGWADVVQLLAQRGDGRKLANIADIYGAKPVSLAAENGHEAIVRLLAPLTDELPAAASSKSVAADVPGTEVVRALYGNAREIALVCCSVMRMAQRIADRINLDPCWPGPPDPSLRITVIGSDGETSQVLNIQEIQRLVEDRSPRRAAAGAAPDQSMRESMTVMDWATIAYDTTSGRMKVTRSKPADIHQRAAALPEAQARTLRAEYLFDCIQQRPALVLPLLDGPWVGDVNHPVAGTTALFLASTNGELPIVDSLLQQPGIKPAQLNIGGLRALHAAAISGHTHVVRRLLLEGAVAETIDTASSSGESVLYYAAREGHTAVVRFLVSLGADTECLKGSAIDAAQQAGHERLAQWLKRHATDSGSRCLTM
jgi:ankyrin repeat protein